MIDLHCHILPGLDDGANSIEQAVEMARIAREDGIEIIAATPHLFRDNALRDFDLIGEKREALIQALAAQGVSLEIKSGAEVHIFHDLVNEVRRHRDQLVLNGSGYMFVEFPADHIYRGAREMFFELMNEGVIPIIAHPERNSVFGQRPELLFDMVSQGALVQANAGSFIGTYGRRAGESVRRLIEWNLVHFVASDGHNTVSLPPRLTEAAKLVSALAGDEVARSLVERNPRAVLNDHEIPYLPAPRDPRKAARAMRLGIPRIFRRSKQAGK
jgi:protein-tyrosine phosphatase